MNNQLKKFFNNYELLQYEIKLQNDLEFDFLNGIMEFYDHDELDSKLIIAEINFTIFNSYNMEYFYDMADSISVDFEYVASTFNRYCDDIVSIGSIAIIDTLVINEEISYIKDKVQVIKKLLNMAIEALSIIGTGTILLMTKALILDANINERLILIDELLKIGFLPICEDETDVVIARNLEYK